MNPERKRAVLCPGCNKLISSDESRCPYCGMRNPGAWWKHTAFIKGFKDAQWYVRIIIYMNVAMYYGKSRGGTYGQMIYKQTGGWVISIILFGMLMPGINNWGHAGGFVSGAILAFLLGYHEKRKENLAHKMLAAACMTGTVGILIWSVMQALAY